MVFPRRWEKVASREFPPSRMLHVHVGLPRIKITRIKLLARHLKCAVLCGRVWPNIPFCAQFSIAFLFLFYFISEPKPRKNFSFFFAHNPALAFRPWRVRNVMCSFAVLAHEFLARTTEYRCILKDVTCKYFSPAWILQSPRRRILSINAFDIGFHFRNLKWTLAFSDN